MIYRNHNKALLALLKELKAKVTTNPNRNAIDAAMIKLKTFSGGYKFDLKGYWIGLAVIIIATIIGTIWDYQRFGYFEASTWGIAIGGFVLSLIAFIVAYHPYQVMRETSSILLQADALLDNNLKVVAVNGKQTAAQWQQRFYEFQRGNHSRDIREVYQGEYSGSDYAFTYQHYHFHYVDKRTVTEVYTDSRGRTRTRTRTVYDHYDRYGLMMPFEVAKNFAILSFKATGPNGASYKPASNRFNKLYEVDAESEMLAAKILEPSVVVAFEDFSPVLRQMNFEVNAAGDLCLSFADSDVIKTPERVLIQDFEAFVAAIEGQQAFDALQKTLAHVHYLKTKLDSNF